MNLLKHILYVDRREDIILLTEILRETNLPYELHSFHNFLNAEEFIEHENLQPDMLIVGSGALHLYGDKRLKEFRNNKRLKKISLIVLIQSELCKQYLIKTHIQDIQFLQRPFDFSAYRELVKNLLLPTCQM